MSECLFCAIVAGDIPGDIVWSDDTHVAFRDVNPQAPHHVLVVPRRHVETAGEYARSDPAGAGALLAAASGVAEQLGIAEAGYRIVLNTGAQAGQTVHHVHAHVLGGRPMGWPPG